MSASHELKTTTVTDFVQEADAANRTLVGYIKIQSENASIILFGTLPAQCPYIPIPKDIIESISLGPKHKCFNNGLPVGMMWYAQIILKEQIPTDSSTYLVKLAVSLADLAAYSRNSYVCGPSPDQDFVSVEKEFRIHDVRKDGPNVSGYIKVKLRVWQRPLGDLINIDEEISFTVALSDHCEIVFNNSGVKVEICYHPNPDRVCASVSAEIRRPRWSHTWDIGCVSF